MDFQWYFANFRVVKRFVFIRRIKIKMYTKPIIHQQLTSLDKALEWSGHTLLLVMWCLTIYVYLNMPAIIPTHFNGAGMPDDHGGKISLFSLPVIASILYLGLTLLNGYPHLFNYAVHITEENAAIHYKMATRMLRYIKLAIIIIFSLIVLFTYFTSAGITQGLGGLFLPFVFGLLFIPVIVMIRQSLKRPNVM